MTMSRASVKRHKDIADGTLVKLEHSTVFLSCHPPGKCAGENCTLHARSDHHMRGYPQHWRGDRYLMERVCPHGCGHPDPDDPSTDRAHGCDGCCIPPLDAA